MPYHYVAFGLRFSSIMELPELGKTIEHDGPAEVTIRIGTVPRHEGDDDGISRETHWIDRHNFWLHVDSVAHFLVSSGRDITIMPAAGADPSAVRAFLLGSACGALLFQRGFLVLHGNAVRIGDGCLVCIGDSGAGKSTLAAGFLARGYQVLADDVVAVDPENCAIPGFPRIKLWQDAADRLGISTKGRMRVLPDIDKYNLHIEVFDPQVRLPIHWIYQIETGNVNEVHLEPIAGLRRFHLLRDNTYRGEYLEGNAMQANHLVRCGQLANEVRMANLQRPAEGCSLDRLIDTLLADVTEDPPRAG